METNSKTNFQADSVPVRAIKQVRENNLVSKLEESKSAIKRLTCQVVSLAHAVQCNRMTIDRPHAKPVTSENRRLKIQCNRCQQDKVPDCNHCFKCGSDTH